ncbi:palmitoyltransferase AKR1 [Pelomyxa schiedti]|nr:palmitoyltransferase AKR1 [Pelomyxa schiedti]
MSRQQADEEAPGEGGPAGTSNGGAAAVVKRNNVGVGSPEHRQLFQLLLEHEPQDAAAAAAAAGCPRHGHRRPRLPHPKEDDDDPEGETSGEEEGEGASEVGRGAAASAEAGEAAGAEQPGHAHSHAHAHGRVCKRGGHVANANAKGRSELDPPTPMADEVKDMLTAAKFGLLPKVLQFFEEDPRSVNMKDATDATTPLHWASYNAHLEVVKFLVSKGADLEAVTNGDKRTPLHWAIVGGNLSVVAYLLKQGSDLEHLDARGNNSLHIAVQHGSDKCTFYCVLKGIPINATDSEGHTPLHWAAYEGNDIVLRFLINNGANINHPDAAGKTPLHWAAIKGNLFCCKVLVSEGADPHRQDNSGSTPLVCAFEKKFLPIARFLRMATRKSLYKKNLEKLNPFWICVGLSSVTVSTLLIAFLPLLLAAFIISIAAASIVIITPHRCPIEGMTQKNPLWLCIFCSGLATSAVIYFRTIFHEFGVVSNLLFILVNFVMMYTYYYMATQDPGFLPQSTITLPKLEELIDSNEFSRYDICLHCSILRPLRARHCFACGRCVARYDHHCAWVNNCVGFRNHRVFHLLTFLTTILHITFIAMCCLYLYHSCYQEIAKVFTFETVRLILRQKVVLWAILFHVGFLSWEFQVAFYQGWCLLRNVTLNEHFNWRRMPWMQSPSGGFRNPFAHGVPANLLDFYTQPVDYSTLFYLHQQNTATQLV